VRGVAAPPDGRCRFGFDSVDTIDHGAWGFDIVDILDEADEVPTHCLGRGRWLYADRHDSKAIGLCWRCHYGGLT
jgi:hypothetical protein